MTNLNALIIDDELDICVLVSAILKQLGIKASFAVTLNDGKKRLKEKSYQILFLDNNLPDGSGLEQIRQINSSYPDMKIIMISAYDADKERETAKHNGAIDFIGKPLSGSAIRSSLKNHFTSLNI
jgi:two-component system, OmpR family, response regulator